jgi:energy-coupling factor transport system permease protein
LSAEPKSVLHPATWIVWTIGVTAAITLTRNPLYLSLILSAVVINHMVVGTSRPDAASWRALIRFAVGLTLFTIPFNALNVHTGSHVLFQLPQNWPIVGGNVTLEAIIWGVCSALGLIALMLLFATFNLAINQAQILRLTPAFIYEAGLIVSIALTFFPQMIASVKEIREAQLIRGHRMRRIRDMLPFVMALLTTGLERSFQLAESMEARGFGNAPPLTKARDLLYKALTLLGLGGLLSGFFMLTYLNAWRIVSWMVIVFSVSLLIAIFWAQGKRVTRTHYRHQPFTRLDGLVVAVCLGTIAALIWFRLTDPASLQYYPYTKLIPPFHPTIGAILLPMILPAVLDRRP